MSDTPSKPRRGRPREYDPDRALASATRVFWKNGYAATSLDELAAATGMNRPSLYAGFGDKRELYLETLKRYRERTRAGVAQLLQESADFRDFLRKYYAAALDIYLGGDASGRGCYSISTAGTQAAVDPTVREYLAESIRATDAFMTTQIRNALERGEIAPAADPEVLASLATATLHTLAIRSRAGSSREQLSALALAAIDVICGPRPAKAP